MKIAALTAAGCLALVSLTACGGGDDEPKASATVSVKSFCSSLEKMDDIDNVKEAKAAFGKLGTPKGIPADAKGGLKTLQSIMGGIDSDTKTDDFQSVLTDAMTKAGTDAAKDVTAFANWVNENCDV